MKQHLDVGDQGGLVFSEVAVQRAELHVLGDDEDGPPFAADAVQLHQVLVLQLTARTDTGGQGQSRFGMPPYSYTRFWFISILPRQIQGDRVRARSGHRRTATLILQVTARTDMGEQGHSRVRTPPYSYTNTAAY